MGLMTVRQVGRQQSRAVHLACLAAGVCDCSQLRASGQSGSDCAAEQSHNIATLASEQ